MTRLSPEAQAVLDAFLAEWDVYAVDKACYGIAAAIRTAAYEVLPREDELIDYCVYEKRNPVREKFLEIADELEAL